MKKHLALALAFIIMSVTACGGVSKGTEQAAAPAATTVQTEAAAPAETPQSENAAAEAAQPEVNVKIPYWTEGSAVADSIVAYVKSVTDESSDSYVAPADRIAIFDFDGTLYGRDIPHILTRACSFTGRSMTRLLQHLMTSGSMRRRWKRPSTITCRNRIPISRQHSAQPSVSRG